MGNDCQNFREQILDFIAGTLPAGRIAELQRHISQCSACRTYLQALQADDELLGDFAESMQPAVARLENNVIDALERRPSKKPVCTIAIWRTITKSRITRLAAAGMVLVVCWFMLTVSNRDKLEEDETNRPVAAVRAKTPSELVSAISLSMVFRDGDLRSVERQFDKAEKKVKSGLKERITIGQLICELEECEDI